MWTPIDAVSLLTYIVFVYWQPTQMDNTDSRNWYDAMRVKIGCTVPGNVFGIAWFILFGLITASTYLFMGPDGSGIDSNLYVAAYVMFIVNVVLTKIWYPVFFNTSRTYIGLALFIAIFILLSAITFMVILIYESAWLPFALYVPYVLWVSYALYLNSRFYFYSSSTTNKSKNKSKSRINSAYNDDYDDDHIHSDERDLNRERERPRSSHRMRQKKPSRNPKPKKITINI